MAASHHLAALPPLIPQKGNLTTASSGVAVRCGCEALAGIGLGGGGGAGTGAGRARSAQPTYADGTNPSGVDPGRTNRLDRLAASITLLPLLE